MDTRADNAVVTESERVAAEQGSEDGEPIPERMEKDEYDDGLPDYGEAQDDVFESKEEMPEPKAPPEARAPDGAAQDLFAAPNIYLRMWTIRICLPMWTIR